MEEELTREQIRENVTKHLIENNVEFVTSQLQAAKGNEGIVLQVEVAGLCTLIRGLAMATQDPAQATQDMKAYVIRMLDTVFTSIIT